MIEVANIGKPDERRDFSGGHIALLTVGGLAFGVARLQPGWRWAESVRPVAGTRRCETRHAAYVEQGRMRMRMEDGEEAEVGPGDLVVLPPGHDAWTVGDEDFVAYDFGGGMADYAKPSGS